ncbi:XdhC family protein [Novosphingobium sp. SG720]|uniref:XdhC family protein n=1 Tax=Novosphingobium sp. SG720 TaxID=2586998 RepID=UPI0014465E3F|nr:XdhC family protein [Novosphingobium sp. SG720]NKJ43429.1 xanthine dehydrogenase accessory factor [Novosphingobium sp. SG720]
MIHTDHAALRAALDDGTGLCTVVGIDGSFSRRVGAQMAASRAGVAQAIAGSLADVCLERQLAGDLAGLAPGAVPMLQRYGRGSPIIDFRLPCGGGLDILLDPAPERAELAQAVAMLDDRQPASLPLPVPDCAPAHLLRARPYIPPLSLVLLGEGAELAATAALAHTMGIATQVYAKEDAGALRLGGLPQGAQADAWTAVLLLFHDHEWERTILRWALDTPAFYIGAQGGLRARMARLEDLARDGVNETQLSRVTSPIGLIPRTRDPGVLALSALAEIMGAYEALHPLA